MLLVHTTNQKNIETILKTGALQSFNMTHNPGEGEGDNIMNKDVVFLSVLFKSYKILIPNIKESNVYLFFDVVKTINNSKALHFCPEWDWGKFIKGDCHYITKEPTAEKQYEQFDKLEELYKKRWNKDSFPERYVFGLPSADFAINEIVFKDEVKLSLNLAGIYCFGATWKHPLLLTTFDEVNSFLNKFGYTDIGTHNWKSGLSRAKDFIQYKKYYKLYSKKGQATTKKVSLLKKNTLTKKAKKHNM